MPAPTDQTLEAIQRQIQAQDFAAARDALQAVLDERPDDPDALYMLAVCQRYLGEAEAAAVTLEQLKVLVPGHGRAHQEEGHLRRSRGDLPGALRAYDRATRANPALLASWEALAALADQLQQPALATQARTQLARLKQLPKALVAVTDLLSQGKLLKAEDLCRKVLAKAPRHVEAMRLLADIAGRLGVLDDAEVLLRNAIGFAPDLAQLRIDYVQVLRKRQQFPDALAEARKLLATAPDNPQFQSIVAVECMQNGDYAEALILFDQVLARLPGDPVTLTSKGHALKTTGDFDGAVAAYLGALASQPLHAEAWYALANLKTYRFSDDELVAMRRLDADSNLGPMDRVYLAFATAKAFEDRTDWDAAFACYARGNGLKRAQSRYDAEAMTRELAAQHAVCTPDLFARHAGSGCPAPDPIFIVGLPRAGSTLLEQILASHSQVDGTLELPNILALAHRLRRGDRITAESRYPGVLEELSADELRGFGEAFIRDTRVHRQGAPFFIDKMPNNFRHIGLIRLILPNAKVIDARRHPLSCCVSGFRQLFAEGQEFSYDLGDLGRYYRDYVALMDHWDAVLPGFVLRVQHEDVVDDLEGQVRRMLDFCGLPFEQACVDYHRTERNVRTPSSEQVRQPIFRDAVEQWRRYDAHLEPLREALGAEVLARYPG